MNYSDYQKMKQETDYDRELRARKMLEASKLDSKGGASIENDPDYKIIPKPDKKQVRSAPNINGGGGGLTSLGLSTMMAGDPLTGGAIAGLGVISDISKRRASAHNKNEEAKAKESSARLNRIQLALNNLANMKMRI